MFYMEEWFNEWVIIDTSKNPSWTLKKNAPDDIKEKFAEIMEEK